MSRRGKIAWGLAGGVLVLTFLGVLSRTPAPPPPDVMVVGAEPVDLIDDTGTELQMVTLRISNTWTQWPSGDARGGLHLFISEEAIRVKRDGAWKAAQYATNTQHLSLLLGPGLSTETTLLAPRHAREGRLRLQFAGPSASVILRYRLWKWLDRWLSPPLFGVIEPLLRRLAKEPYHRLPMSDLEWDIELTPGSHGSPEVPGGRTP
jgi:hypothetical protein